MNTAKYSRGVDFCSNNHRHPHLLLNKTTSASPSNPNFLMGTGGIGATAAATSINTTLNNYSYNFNYTSDEDNNAFVNLNFLNSNNNTNNNIPNINNNNLNVENVKSCDFNQLSSSFSTNEANSNNYLIYNNNNNNNNNNNLQYANNNIAPRAINYQNYKQDPNLCYSQSTSGHAGNLSSNNYDVLSPETLFYDMPLQQEHEQQTVSVPPVAAAPISWHHPQPTHEQMLNMHNLSNRCEYEDSKASNKTLNGREARNRAEKNRRDKLNGSIQELSGMVPHVAESPRRVDKTAVLRYSAHGLRLDHVFGKSTGTTVSKINSKKTEFLLKLLDSFLITITLRGQILLVSPSVEQYLGHCQTDLYGQNILTITHPDDKEDLQKYLIPTDLQTLFERTSSPTSPPQTSAGTDQTDDINNGHDHRSQDEEDEIDRKLREDRRNFLIRLARAGPRSEPVTYEQVRIDGCFRRADSATKGQKSAASNNSTGLQLVRRARSSRDDTIPLHTINGNDIVLIAMATIVKPPSICERLIEACKYEYKTRHLIDGQIVECDERISIVAGYLTDEVFKVSAFQFMHKDDVRWVMVALRQMYDFNKPTGESCYRLLTKHGQFIYLKTTGFLEIDKSTNKVHTFICINTMVPEEEGKKLIKQMKNRFSVIINSNELAENIDKPNAEEPTVENPQKMEKAIMNLITNLQPGSDEFEGAQSPGPAMDALMSSSSTIQQSLCSPASTSSMCSFREAKSPSLAIIAPKASTIKPSIFRATGVMTKKNLSGLTSPRSSSCDDFEDVDENDDEYANDSDATSHSNKSRGFVAQKISYSKTINGGKNLSSLEQIKIKTEPNPLSPAQSDVEARLPPLPNSDNYLFHNDYDMNSRDFARNNGGVRNNHIHQTGYISSTATHTISAYSSASQSGDIRHSPSGGQQRPSVLKRTHNDEVSLLEPQKKQPSYLNSRASIITSRASFASPESLLAPSIKKLSDPNSDLAEVLPTTLQVLDKSLFHIEGTTAILREQYYNYNSSMPAVNTIELNKIMEEHQQQRASLQSLHNDFTAEITQNSSSSTTASASTSSNNQSANIQINPTIGSINMPLKSSINNNNIDNSYIKSGGDIGSR